MSPTRQMTRPSGGFAGGAARLLLVSALVALTSAAGAAPTATEAHWDWRQETALPADFDPPVVPAGNPMSRAKVRLGRHLFYDPQLSGNGRMACAGCHFQHLAFTDGKALPTGSTGDIVPRSAQGLANVAYQATLTWANPLLTTLERQMETPLLGLHPVEMGINSGNQAQVLARFARDQGRVGYRAMFAAAFPEQRSSQRISLANVVLAIAAFERTMISGNSRYDLARRGEVVLSTAEERGRRLFNSEQARCARCHSGPSFSDQAHNPPESGPPRFHNTGLYNVDGRGGYPDSNRGVFETSQVASDMGLFRAPSLRNVALTAPYMHDGHKPDLQAVLDHYAAGGTQHASGPLAGDGRANPFKDPLIDGIRLDEQDKADPIAFLKTLTDESFLQDPRLSDPFSKRPNPTRSAAR